MYDCARRIMARMESVAIKNDVATSCGFIDGSRSTRARWIKWRGQTWHVCRFVPRDSPESADMCLSAGQRIAISGLGSWEIALGVVWPRKNLSQRGFRLSDSAMWIVRLWVAWYGRLLASSDS